MFSLKVVDEDFTRSFGVIIQKDPKGSTRKVVETLYHTELVRDRGVDYDKESKDFNDKMYKTYCSSIEGGEYILKDNFEFEMACHDKVTKGFERFIKIIYGPSGSGKTFTLAKLIRKYRQAFPQNSIIYASVNDVKNEPAFDSLVEPVLDTNGKPLIDKATGKPQTKSIIREIDLKKIDTIIDVFAPEFKDSLLLFDDLDANTGVFSYTDLDPNMTPEKFKELKIAEQAKITDLVEKKMEVVSRFLKATAKSVIFNARKQRINFAYIFHAFFNNRFENELLGEATSVVVFPQKADKATLTRWLSSKLLFSKAEAAYLTNRKWRKWDFLEIDKSTGQKFALMNDTLKLF